MDDTDVTYVTKWQEFIQSETGKTTISNWQRQLQDAQMFLSVDDDVEICINDNEESEEWKYKARLNGLNSSEQAGQLCNNIFLI